MHLLGAMEDQFFLTTSNFRVQEVSIYTCSLARFFGCTTFLHIDLDDAF
jgi:hypothetical protein